MKNQEMQKLLEELKAGLASSYKEKERALNLLCSCGEITSEQYMEKRNRLYAEYAKSDLLLVSTFNTFVFPR